MWQPENVHPCSVQVQLHQHLNSYQRGLDNKFIICDYLTIPSVSFNIFQVFSLPQLFSVNVCGHIINVLMLATWNVRGRGWQNQLVNPQQRWKLQEKSKCSPPHPLSRPRYSPFHPVTPSLHQTRQIYSWQVNLLAACRQQASLLQLKIALPSVCVGLGDIKRLKCILENHPKKNKPKNRWRQNNAHILRLKMLLLSTEVRCFSKKCSKLAILTQSGMKTVNILHELYRCRSEKWPVLPRSLTLVVKMAVRSF